jgi:predicted transcriptional regulator of viral defense system
MLSRATIGRATKRQACSRRLGYLLEAANISVYGSLKNLISGNYELLNPLQPPTHRKNGEWKIIVNEALE